MCRLAVPRLPSGAIPENGVFRFSEEGGLGRLPILHGVEVLGVGKIVADVWLWKCGSNIMEVKGDR